MRIDQAHNLKRIIQKSPKPSDQSSSKKRFGVLSGKGGVGKSVITVNTGILLAEKGLKTLIVDADFMSPSLHVLANVNPTTSLEIWIKKPELDLHHIISPVEKNLYLVTSEGEGFDEHLKDWQYVKLLRRCLLEAEEFDIVLIDFPTGFFGFLNPVLFELDELMIVSTPEPTSVIDTYAMIKILTKEVSYEKIKVIINMADNENEARESVENLNRALTHFLSIQVNALEFIPFSPRVKNSVMSQIPISYNDNQLFAPISEYLAYCLQ
jgi:flagellar biosynthesis protein FlhG